MHSSNGLQKDTDDSFELFDLRIEVCQRQDRPMACHHPLGSSFVVSGESLILSDGLTFPIYCLAALIPLFPAKQRMTHRNDWMTSDADVACPDPHCGGIFRIKRLEKRKFYRSQVTLNPLDSAASESQVISYE